MHGCSSGSALLVNAEVDSMGGVVDGGVGIGLKTSPRRAAIEKAQAELRSVFTLAFTFSDLHFSCFPSNNMTSHVITGRSMMCVKKEEGN